MLSLSMVDFRYDIDNSFISAITPTRVWIESVVYLIVAFGVLSCILMVLYLVLKSTDFEAQLWTSVAITIVLGLFVFGMFSRLYGKTFSNEELRTSLFRYGNVIS